MSSLVESLKVTSTPDSLNPSNEIVESKKKPTRAEILREAEKHKSDIAKILSIDGLQGWSIVDSRPDEGLYMIHADDTHLEQYGHLNGVVVDVPNNILLVGSRGFIPVAIMDTLTKDDTGKIVITDTFGEDHVISEKHSAVINPLIEGERIRIFKHNGKIYFSSEKKLNVDRSRVHNSITFLEMYDALGGPSSDLLFDPNLPYSPVVYSFVISSPEVRFVSKIKDNKGFLVFDGTYNSYGREESPYPLDEVSFNEWRPYQNISDDIDKVTSDNSIDFYRRKRLSLDEANMHLSRGYYPEIVPPTDDIRKGLGESVHIYIVDENEDLVDQIEVRSPAYNWRYSTRDEQFNLKYQFYGLVNSMYIDTNSQKGLDDFLSRFPLYPQYDVNEIITYIEETGPIIQWPTTLPPDPENLQDEEGRLYNIWVSLLMSVPLYQQSIVAPMWLNFFEERNDVIEWLQMMEDTYEDPQNNMLGYRGVQIIKTARQQAQKATLKGESTQERIDANIRFYIEHERGDSLYRLIRSMRQYKSREQDD